jgi:hypothetical protein
MVLLRNDGALPLGRGRKLAVVGVHATTTTSLLSDYFGDQACFGEPTPDSIADCAARNGGATATQRCARTRDECFVSIGGSLSDANARHGGETRVAAGVGMTSAANASEQARALDAVGWADVVALAVGIDNSIEHEGIDRADSLLPAAQLAFATRVLGSGKPVILLLVNGGTLAIDSLVGGADAPHAIIELFYPNVVGAKAMGPAVFGETNRWGKLPLTVYPAAYDSQLTIEQVRMRSDAATGYPGRGYRYYTGAALFEFGEGLSLTNFSTSCRNDSVAGDTHVHCVVRNSGGVAGDEVVMVFHRPPVAPPDQPPAPIRRLLDFARLSDIAPGASKSCAVVILRSDLALVGEGEPGDMYARTSRVPSGVHAIEVGTAPQRERFELVLA